MPETNLLFLPLMKVDVEQRMVYATAADEGLDRANEIFDYESSKPLIAEWSAGVFKTSGGQSYGNVRAMHNKVAAGKIAEPITFHDDLKRVDVAIKVVDDAEWSKVLEGVYTGVSFGGSYAKRWTDSKNPMAKRYTAQPNELSLADLPCIPGATFQMVKAAGVVEEVPFKKVAQREDTSPKEGKDKYGDVKFADETNKKYPLDTKAHVRAAASYFGMPKNRSKYSAADQKKIDAKIKAAKKKFGIGEEDKAEKLATALLGIGTLIKSDVFVKTTGTDNAERLTLNRDALRPLLGKLTAGETLEKGMYGVASLAQAIATIDCIAKDAEWESAAEGDESEIPAKLAEIRESLGEVLVQMAQEEVDEMNPNDPTEEEEAMTEAEKVALLQSLEKVTKAAEQSQAQVAELTKTNTDLAARLAKLEAAPDPAQPKPSSVAADAMGKVFEPRGLGGLAGHELEKAAPVLELFKAARAEAIGMDSNGTFQLKEGTGNMAKLA